MSPLPLAHLLRPMRATTRPRGAGPPPPACERTPTRRTTRENTSRSEDHVRILPAQSRGRIDGVDDVDGRLGACQQFLLNPLLQQLCLFLLHNLLYPEKLLAGLFIHLQDDVVDRVLDPRDNDVLQRVHAPARHLDLLVEGLEGRLQRRQPHELSHGLEVGLPGRVDDGTTMSDAQRLFGGIPGAVAGHLEDGDADAGNVIGHELDQNGRLLGALDDGAGDVVARVGPLRLGEGEGGVLQALAHQQLRLHDVLQQKLEARLQGVTLLLEQLEALRGASAAGLEGLQGHAVR
mmetsp:Transcript_18539/g.64857  ORF Transcript_18539/g.64857 Transcript_18539/m.64857 type:complete len:291 (+) Transcript_18539:312-1184(+)